MKRLLLWLCLFCIYSTTYGQADGFSPVQYDTLSNIQSQKNRHSYLQYVGQSLFFYEYAQNPSDEERYITRTFTLVKPDTTWINKRRKRPEQFRDYNVRTAYGAIECGRNATPAKSIEGSVFKIVDYTYKDQIVFTLEDKSGIQLYWSVSEYTYDDNIFPCIIVSFYDKLKEIYIGQSFVASVDAEAKYKDLMSRNSVNTREPSMRIGLLGEPFIFKCVGVDFVKFDGLHAIPLLLFKNNDLAVIGVKPVLMPRDNPNNSLGKYVYPGTAYLSDFEPYETHQKRKEAERLERQQALEEFDRQLEENRKLYGNRIGTMIMLGDVEVGMTTKMCIVAWGLPDKINRTITTKGSTSQWVYDKKGYLYFDENSVLEAIQKSL